MPANRGIGRKHKAGTGGSKSQPAERKMSAIKLAPDEAPSKKRAWRQKPPPLPVPPPVHMTLDEVDALGW